MSQETKETRSLSPSEVQLRIGELELQHRLDEALQFVDPDAIDHVGGAKGDIQGIAAIKNKWDHLFDHRRDLSVILEEHVASGELTANLYTLRAVDTATGLPYEIRIMDMMRVRDGKMVEHWAIPDHDAKRHQLGLDK